MNRSHVLEFPKILVFLLVEAAQVTVRSNPEWRRKCFHSGDAPRTEDRQGSDGP